jgi:hypothetical protein
MHSDFQNRDFFNGVFFAMAHIIIWCIVFWYGYRHLYPFITLLLIVTSGFICFTIGTHLFAIDVKEIREVVMNGRSLQGSAKSLIGGLLLVVPMLLIIKKLLGFHHDVFLPYAYAIPQFRWPSVSFCVLAFFLMSQKSPVKEDDAVKNDQKYHEIGIGGYVGNNTMTSDRDDGVKYKENYYLVGAGYRFVNELSPNQKLTLGIGGSYGRLKEIVEDNYGFSYEYSQIMYSVHPYVQYDMKYIGIGLGVALGDISLFRGYVYYKPSFTAFQRYSALPMVHLRAGNLERVWGEFNYCYRFPGFAPSNEFELLLGVNLSNGDIIRVGTSSFHALVFRAECNIQNKFIIEPYIGLFGPLMSGSYVDTGGYQGGLNLRYRLY